jgi:hypothetical protein
MPCCGIFLGQWRSSFAGSSDGKMNVQSAGALTPYISQYSLDKRFGKLQSRSGHYGEDKNLLPLSGIKLCSLDLSARSLVFSETVFLGNKVCNLVGENGRASQLIYLSIMGIVKYEA